MVKGVSRQIVVVETPDPHLFEQAIFIVRDGAAGEGVTSKTLVQEARRVAKNCVTGRQGNLRCAVSPQAAAALGAAAVGAAWIAAVLLA